MQKSNIIKVNSEIHMKRALEAKFYENWSEVISEIDLANSALYPIDPTSTPLLWYRGVANFLLNNLDQAQQEFQLAYIRHPYHIHILNNLATCYERKGEHSTAIHFYKCDKIESAV